MKLSEFENNDKTSERTSSEQILMEKFDEYKNMGHDELSDRLFSEVKKQKENGVFNYDKLEKMVENLHGAIPEENYDNIKRILEGLK